VLLVSCSTTTLEKAVPLGPAEVRSAKAAADAITVGRSTKADVRAALGQAVVVDFATGYEVWVYRERPRDKAASELVLLFDPAGVVTKTRVR
jgi:outer membrane protein assembly factor BamE (lipoprotein component of BamABCDE complex)